MEPMRVVAYVVMSAVSVLMIIGGAGFYAGYTTGRMAFEDRQAQRAGVQGAVTVIEGEGKAVAVSLEPVIDQIKALGAQIDKMAQDSAGSPASDSELRTELAALNDQLSAATEQFNSCQQQLSALETQIQAAERPAGSGQKADLALHREETAVVLYDNVLLKSEENKLYDDVDVDLTLQDVTSRSAQVAVNRQSFGIAFGERKIFQHNNVTCELILMETDLQGNQARLSIACKR